MEATMFRMCVTACLLLEAPSLAADSGPPVRREQPDDPWMPADPTARAPIATPVEPVRGPFQSVQVNIDAGKLPDPHDNERRYLRIPINVFKPQIDREEIELRGV